MLAEIFLLRLQTEVRGAARAPTTFSRALFVPIVVPAVRTRAGRCG